MGRADRITILLSVAALCVTIIGTSCSTNGRIDDLNESLNARIDHLNESLNARIDHLRAEVAAQIAAVNARIDDLSASLNARIDALERDIRDLRAIVLDAVRVAPPAAVVPAADQLTRSRRLARPATCRRTLPALHWRHGTC